jgi:hypothetical protein
MRSSDGRFEYRDAHDAPLPDGAAPLDVARFAFRCRRAATQGWCSLNIAGRGHDIANRSWSWDGYIDQPTLLPSVNCVDCWHGFVRAGVFVDCGGTPEAKQ